MIQRAESYADSPPQTARGLGASRAVLLVAAFGGRHLWPLSRADRPKALAPVLFDGGPATLLERAFNRALTVVAADRVFIAVAAGNEARVSALLPSVPNENILGIPEDRDTLPTLGLATLRVERRLGGNVCLLVDTVDHLGRAEGLTKSYLQALEAAEDGQTLVSVGLSDSVAPAPVGAPRAPQVLGSSCVFAWRPATFWAALLRVAPDEARRYELVRKVMSDADALRRAFGDLRRADVGHGLLDHLGPDSPQSHRPLRGLDAHRDGGRFSAIARPIPRDGAGNQVRATGDVQVTATGCIVLATDTRGRSVEVSGVTDLIVCVDGDDVLVADKAAEGDVRYLAAAGFDVGTRVPNGSGPVKRAGPRTACRVDADTPGTVALVGNVAVEVTVSPTRVVVKGVPVAAPPPARRKSIVVSIDDSEELTVRRMAAALVAHFRQIADEKQAPMVTFTGAIPRRLFEILRADYLGAVPWGRFTLAQAEEYVGMTEHDRRCIQQALRRDVLEPLGFGRFLPLDGMLTDAQLAVRERRVAGRGIDFALHAIARDGRVGFVQPFQDWTAEGGRVLLSAETREELGGSADHALTFGLPTLLAAPTIFAIGVGRGVRAAVDFALLAPPSMAHPVSAIRERAAHASVSCFLDRSAGESLLTEHP